MCLCVFTCACVFTDACGDQGSTSAVFLNCFNRLHFQTGLPVNLELPNLVPNGGQQAQGVPPVSSLLDLRLQIDAQLSFMLVLGILTKPSPQPAKDPSSTADCPSRHCTHRHYTDTHLGQFIQKKTPRSWGDGSSAKASAMQV